MSDAASRINSLFGSPEDDPLLEDDPLAGADDDADDANEANDASDDALGADPPGEARGDASASESSRPPANAADNPPQGPAEEVGESGGLFSVPEPDDVADSSESDSGPEESLDALLGTGSHAPTTEPETAGPDSSDAASPAGAARDRSSDQRRLMISQEAAGDGRLAPLTVALKRGWTLQRIHLATDTPRDTPPIVFILDKSDADK